MNRTLQTMMQVVSLGETDELSEEEIEESLDLQLSFCASHQDIVEELKNRGVLLRQVNYQPPRREHAKKICTSEFSSESRRTVTRRKRTARCGRVTGKHIKVQANEVD